MTLEHVLSPQVRLTQEQTLTPAQMQSLSLLAAPVMELQEAVAVELERNPLLESDASRVEELSGDLFEQSSAAAVEPDRAVYDGDEEDFSRMSELADGWTEAVMPDRYAENLGAVDRTDFAQAAGNSRDSERQKQRDFMLDSLVAADSLQSDLLKQLALSDEPDPKVRHAAELVIGSIDENGFLATPEADIAMAGECTLEDTARAVTLVQSFEPAGIAAHDVAESLALQLRRRGERNRKLYELLEHHLGEIERNHLPQVAKAMKISMEDLQELLLMLKKLNPYPVFGLNTATSEFIVPEMEVRFQDGELVIVNEGRYLPRLHLVSRYLEMLDDPTTPPETRSYLREKLSSAENLMKIIQLRQHTLVRITEIILDTQKNFFSEGIAALVPMTMAQVSEKLNLHETTISRAVANKYLKTPQGVLEYRFFFSGGYQTASGEEVSVRCVKAKLRELIDAENPLKPLSDAALAEQLKSDGIDVARRTVAKYRESMNIPPTNLRRKHV